MLQKGGEASTRQKSLANVSHLTTFVFFLLKSKVERGYPWLPLKYAAAL